VLALPAGENADRDEDQHAQKNERDGPQSLISIFKNVVGGMVLCADGALPE
jgi:hypothetical protein